MQNYIFLITKQREKAKKENVPKGTLSSVAYKPYKSRPYLTKPGFVGFILI